MPKKDAVDNDTDVRGLGAQTQIEGWEIKRQKEINKFIIKYLLSPHKHRKKGIHCRQLMKKALP